MSEIINLRKEFQNLTYLSHLILESDKYVLRKVVESVDYDITKVNIEVSLNGVKIRYDLLEPILKNWTNRLAKEKIELEHKKLKDTKEWIVAMKEKESLEYEIEKRCKEKLQKLIDRLDVYD